MAFFLQRVTYREQRLVIDPTDWPSPNFLEMYCYFYNTIGQLCLSGPGYSSRAAASRSM